MINLIYDPQELYRLVTQSQIQYLNSIGLDLSTLVSAAVVLSLECPFEMDMATAARTMDYSDLDEMMAACGFPENDLSSHEAVNIINTYTAVVYSIYILIFRGLSAHIPSSAISSSDLVSCEAVITDIVFVVQVELKLWRPPGENPQYGSVMESWLTTRY